MDINTLLKSINIATLLDEEELSQIGTAALRGYEIDEASRTEWKERTELAMNIAKQTLEKKNHPFPNASNVKYPLIPKSAIDFAARLYPEIVNNDRVVKCSAIGSDELGLKEKRAVRVSRHMSYQLLQENDEWEEGTDKLLHILPVIGTVFRKTYYDPILKRNVSEFCHPEYITVNYAVTSLETARRITHRMFKYANDLVERARAGIYLEIDLDSLKSSEGYGDGDLDPPLELLEQHCFIDLDKDGYDEPYIVTLHKATQKVLRIVARYSASEIKKNRDGEIYRIEADQYFTDYHCIKSPDGGFYSIGLGHLLYPLNEAINTSLNQLIDSGTLSNSQAGFLGRGLRIKGGDIHLRLGQWKVLDAATGTDIRANIVPLPVREPSLVLFQLLGFLVEAGKDLSSLQDTLMGKGQTQNVPATTILTMVEQGMKVFNAIQKRLYRSFKKEYVKLFKLNSKHLTNAEYQRVLDDPMADVESDYDLDSLDIVPIADPNASSDTQRLARARALYELPNLDPYAKTKYLLEALQISETRIRELLPVPNPNAPPPPDVMKMLAETDRAKSEAALNMQKTQLDVAELDLKRQQLQLQAQEAEARINKMAADSIVSFEKLENVENKQKLEAQKEVIRLRFEQDKTEAELAVKSAEIGLKTNVELEKLAHDTRTSRDNNS